MSISTGIIGGSGYAGGELLRILAAHSHFQLSYISAGNNAGEFITEIHPHLTQYAGKKFSATDTTLANDCELLFLALPHGESAKLIPEIKESIKIVDLGADFRLESAEKWQQYYGGQHAGSWEYGLADIFSEQISTRNRVANPGCYATAIALAIAPALARKVADASDVVAVAASGTTGAGRSAKTNLIGSEVMNSLSSYKFGGVHQHTPEIEQTLTSVAGSPSKVSFTPILAPMPRGILATVTSHITQRIDLAELREIYTDFYRSSPFVHLLNEGQMPATSSVLGTNHAHIQVAIDHHTNRIVTSCAIDNLGKGAAAQAVHNANLMFGFDQSLGLEMWGVK